MKTDWIDKQYQAFLRTGEIKPKGKRSFYVGALAAMSCLPDSGIPFNELPKSLQDMILSMSKEIETYFAHPGEPE